MRLTLFIIVSAIFFCSCKKSKSGPPPPRPILDTLSGGWTKTVIPGEPRFYEIFFVQNTGFVLSNHHIYRSVDGGVNWSVVYSTPQDPSANAGMGNASNALFVSAGGKIRITHNGGNTFDSVIVADRLLSDVFFVSPTIAYASGESLWKTTDAGDHWTKLYDFPATPEFNYRYIHFIGEQTGWASGPPGFFKTTNGGTNWQKINTPINVDGASLFFPDVNTGYISGYHGQIAKSSDGGANWSLISNGNPGNPDFNSYSDLHFFDANSGYYCHGRDVFKTTNGGTSWQRVAKIGGEDRAIIEIHFTDPTRGWACGTNGTILRYVQ